MQNQDLLKKLNESWPLGLDTSCDIPKLRFQKDDQLMKGYELIFCEGLEVDYNKLAKANNEKFDSNLITREDIYNIIYFTLYNYLTMCFLENNNGNDRVIAVGHCSDGKPVIFCSDDDTYKHTSFIKDFIYTYLFDFDKEFGIPYKYLTCFGIGTVEGILQYLPVSNYYDYNSIFYAMNKEDRINSLLMPNIGSFMIGYNPKIGSEALFASVFKPNPDNFDYTVDYLLFDNKIVFLNDFSLNKFYEENIKTINKLCEYYPESNILKNKNINCFDRIKTLLKEKDIISNLLIDKVLDLFDFNDLFVKTKYWIVKESCYNNSSDRKEIFPKGLICSTDNIDKDKYLNSLSIDGNIELNVIGIDKIKKVPYSKIETFVPSSLLDCKSHQKSSSFNNNEISDECIDKNKLLWAERDRILYKDTGIFDFFINQNDEIIFREFYVNKFSCFVNKFIRNYIKSNYSAIKDDIKTNLQHFELTKTRINEDKYSEIVDNITSDLDINITDLIVSFCGFARYWNIKFYLNDYISIDDQNSSRYRYYNNSKRDEDKIKPDDISKEIIKNLSLYRPIEENDLISLEKCFCIYYMNSYINEKSEIKASEITNLRNNFAKEDNCFKKRKLIYEFRNLIGLKDYVTQLNKNISKSIREIASYNLYSLIKIKRDDLYKNIKNNLKSIFESICQYPNIENTEYQRLNFLWVFNFLRNTENIGNMYYRFSMLTKQLTQFDNINQIQIKLQSIIEKLLIIDKINLDYFKQKTRKFLLNIYCDLEKDKNYTKEELESIWEKRNSELDYNTKEEYSLDVTIDNLIKAGFLEGYGNSYALIV